MHLTQSKKQILTGLLGLLIGFTGGLFGAGGGVICVLLLRKRFHMDPRTAHASAVAVMLPITLSSAIIYLTHHSVNAPLTWKTSLGALLGGLLAGILMKKIKTGFLTKLFGILMIITGVWMVL